MLKLFVDTLLDMFGAVLMARMLVERREDAMFDRKLQPGRTYPYGELVGPLPKPAVADLLVVRDPPRSQWKCQFGFKEDLIRWLRELQWKPAGEGHVTFVELALDFEAHSECALPATPSAVFKAEVMSLHERARVL